jgi:c-di-GMP-binding flagellar brake protein YcgR
VQSVKNNAPKELRIWEKIVIIAGEGRDAGVYETRVEDMFNGGIVVNNPEFVSGHTLLRNDLSVIVQFTREDAAYQFHSRVRIQNSDNARRVILAPPLSFQRVQRRMFARVECPLHVMFAAAPADGNWQDWQKSGSWQETFAVDISAGGVQLKMPSQTATGTVLFLRISDLGPSEPPYDFVSVCRRSGTKEGQAYAGFEFVVAGDLKETLSKTDLQGLPDSYKHFDRRAQDHLATLLFHKQIELRQKGLI